MVASAAQTPASHEFCHRSTCDVDICSIFPAGKFQIICIHLMGLVAFHGDDQNDDDDDDDDGGGGGGGGGGDDDDDDNYVMIMMK